MILIRRLRRGSPLGLLKPYLVKYRMLVINCQDTHDLNSSLETYTTRHSGWWNEEVRSLEANTTRHSGGEGGGMRRSVDCRSVSKVTRSI